MKTLTNLFLLLGSFTAFGQTEDLPINDKMGRQELYNSDLEVGIVVYWDENTAVIVYSPESSERCACEEESYIVLTADADGNYALKDEEGETLVKLDLIDGSIEITEIITYTYGECCTIVDGSYVTPYTD
ncbi:MAG: hypothetical protein ACK45H_01910 [Bacteroidota bacterium]|jgi:hypothetical protein